MSSRSKPSSDGPRSRQGPHGRGPNARSQQALNWAVPGNPRFEIVRKGALIVASGEALSEQLQSLVELSKEAAHAEGAFLYLYDPKAVSHILVAKADGDPHLAKNHIYHVDIDRESGPVAKLILQLGSHGSLGDELEGTLELIGRQVLSTVTRDHSAWKKLLDERRQ